MTHQTDSMTVTQAARKLGVHRRTVDRLVARGRLSRNQLTGCIAAAQIEDVKVERFNQQERGVSNLPGDVDLPHNDCCDGKSWTSVQA
jgi:IS30 family transposase